MRNSLPLPEPTDSGLPRTHRTPSRKPSGRRRGRSGIWAGIAAALTSALFSGSAAFGATGGSAAGVDPGITEQDCNAAAGHPGGVEPCSPTSEPAPALSAASPPVGVPGAWSLVFEDDFLTLNRSVWTPYWFKDCGAGSVMNLVQTCSSNVSVADGVLRLQMSAADKGALVSTNPKDGVAGHAGAAFGLGYYEAKVLFPGRCSARLYNWPAWWTTGQAWPATGENDIAEPISGLMQSNYHSSAGDSGRSITGCWAGEYHVYGLHRKPGMNDVYYDGRLVHSYPTRDGGALHHLVLNVGYSPGSKVLGAAGAVLVDYVRVWS